jgi:predicted ester cyclase
VTTTTGRGMRWDEVNVWQASKGLAFVSVPMIVAAQDQIAEGDKVVTRLTGRGTFTGEILRIPPNGPMVTMKGMAIHRIVGGQLVEHWAVADKLSFLQQMGAIPPLA